MTRRPDQVPAWQALAIGAAMAVLLALLVVWILATGGQS